MDGGSADTGEGGYIRCAFREVDGQRLAAAVEMTAERLVAGAYHRCDGGVSRADVGGHLYIHVAAPVRGGMFHLGELIPVIDILQKDGRVLRAQATEGIDEGAGHQPLALVVGDVAGRYAPAAVVVEVAVEGHRAADGVGSDEVGVGSPAESDGGGSAFTTICVLATAYAIAGRTGGRHLSAVDGDGATRAGSIR